LQGEDSNFHTDLFLPLLHKAEQLVGKPYDRGPAGAPFRVLADHARAVTFLLTDGCYPSNEGRGYVLRRILRRGVRYAWLLGRKEPTLAPLTALVVQEMGHAYPELTTKAAYVADVTRQEEERFLETIEAGLKRIDELLTDDADWSGPDRPDQAHPLTISGEEAFKLYATYGFPIDLIQLIAAEHGATVDVARFEQLLERERRRSREVRAQTGRLTYTGFAPTVIVGHEGDWRKLRDQKQAFVGYDTTGADTEILAFREAGGRVDLLLRDNPFYVESGGQVSDTGLVRGTGWTLAVDAVRKAPEGTVVSAAFEGGFEPTPVAALVDVPRRRNIERNHSATHLVHAALRRHLGDHVRQQGSLVEPGRLRFDFSHHGPIEPAVLAEIEREVNEQIWENRPVTTREMATKDALALGAMAFFQDKYGDRVRVVSMDDYSIELCGGTHVRTTGQLGLFRFTGQGGVAAGVRRIEAVTGPEAYGVVEALRGTIDEAAHAVKAQPDNLLHKLGQLVAERERLEARVAEFLRSGSGAGQGTTITVGDVAVTVAETSAEDRNEIAAVADSFRTGKAKAVLVLLGSTEKGGVHVALTDDLVEGGRQARQLVERLGGKGGGRPYFASGSLARERQPDVTGLPAVIESWLSGGGKA
ncbi:MAG TPA: alanine--tRNA ligase-related protein, partial [Gemmatimonadales bacterium]|nr:alanine--tRNA ligase-related protein [Gemmatimonadales bacterium]